MAFDKMCNAYSQYCDIIDGNRLVIIRILSEVFPVRIIFFGSIDHRQTTFSLFDKEKCEFILEDLKIVLTLLRIILPLHTIILLIFR